jgi:alpha-amylase/alpha-mannosidase (GH57 family)
MLAAFQREEMPVPQELKVAAEVALSYRCIKTANHLEQGFEDPVVIDNALAELTSTATEANHLECWLNIPELKLILEDTIVSLLQRLLAGDNPADLEADVTRIETAIALGQQLRLGLALDQAQEIYFSSLHQDILPNCLMNDLDDLVDSSSLEGNSCPWKIPQIKSLLKLGQSLAIDVSCWL